MLQCSHAPILQCSNAQMLKCSNAILNKCIYKPHTHQQTALKGLKPVPVHAVAGLATCHGILEVKVVNRIIGKSAVAAHSAVALMSWPSPNAILLCQHQTRTIRHTSQSQSQGQQCVQVELVRENCWLVAIVDRVPWVHTTYIVV